MSGCRAQAELDGIQEEQSRMGELGIGISPLQAADLDRRMEKVAKLVKVSNAVQCCRCLAATHLYFAIVTPLAEQGD